MNVKRFTARTSREALNLVKQTFGDDAVVLSNKPCAEGVEVLAMAPEGMGQIEKMHSANAGKSAAAPRAPSRVQARPEPQEPARRPSFAERASRQEPSFGHQDPMSAPDVGSDVQTLAMSTLSFQDYVRDRVLKRRQAELSAPAQPHVEPTLDDAPASPARQLDVEMQAARKQRAAAALQAMQPKRPEPVRYMAPTPQPPQQPQQHPQQQAPRRAMPPVLRDEIRVPEPIVTRANLRAVPADMPADVQQELADISSRGRREQADMMAELRQMKGLIEERFGALAFMEKLQRQPVQAKLIQKLLEVGFSPALTRKLVENCPATFSGTGELPDENAWAQLVLSRNLITDEKSAPLEEQGGVFALIGSTGVGKTTTTAKLAAAFATRFGAANLGLITLDAYRVGAHEQLRAYGRILGVPVHTAHDRASLEDLLELLANKKMVLVDTAGMAQRDSRCAELLDMLAHPSIRRILVVNAAQQGETIEDVVTAWKASECHGVVLSKIDEAVKLAPALDTMIRHRLKVLAVANGQRVPEDWHRLSAASLMQRALRSPAVGAWRMDSSDVNLIFAAAPPRAVAQAAAF